MKMTCNKIIKSGQSFGLQRKGLDSFGRGGGHVAWDTYSTCNEQLNYCLRFK